MNEADIMHESGQFWVCRERNAYTVYVPYRGGSMASESDSSYAKTTDGLSIAIARCNWLAKRHAEKTA
jgi:hypothetical protein